MNKIEIIYQGEIEKGYRKKGEKGVWPGVLTISIPKKGILRGVKINAPKLPNGSVVILKSYGEEFLHGKLWMFDGGMIPLDIDLRNHMEVDLQIENPTTRETPIEVAISKELRPEELL